MKKLIKTTKELAPYLLVASIVVGLLVTALAYIMPTVKQIEPAASTLLKMSGSL